LAKYDLGNYPLQNEWSKSKYLSVINEYLAVEIASSDDRFCRFDWF
jgi:uncharacterized protein YktA (UPF0223 family)